MPKGIQGFQKGHKSFLTEKSKKKIGRTLRGLHRSVSEEEKRKARERMSGDKNPAKRLEVRKRIGESNSSRTGKKARNWKNGLPKCKDCGKELSQYNRKRCWGCFVKFNRGKNSGSYRNGKTSEQEKIRHSIESCLWRKSVFLRDHFTCQKCFQKRGGYLHSHHIQNFSQWPELRFVIDNGITFCREHHKEFHKIYGIKNNTREQVEEYLKYESSI